MDPYFVPVGMGCSSHTPDGCDLCVSGSYAASFETFWADLQSSHETQWRMAWIRREPA